MCSRTHPWRRARGAFWLLAACFLMSGAHRLEAQPQDEIDDITGKYHFLSPDDTLAILEEEGKLKGYVDVYQSEEESDAILSYPITLGSRTRNHVEFKTGKIHEKYYRFTGAAERGSGQKDGDPDYLRLVGDLEIVTLNSATAQESVEHRRAVFKSIGKNERPADNDQNDQEAMPTTDERTRERGPGEAAALAGRASRRLTAGRRGAVSWRARAVPPAAAFGLAQPM